MLLSIAVLYIGPYTVRYRTSVTSIHFIGSPRKSGVNNIQIRSGVRVTRHSVFPRRDGERQTTYGLDIILNAQKSIYKIDQSLLLQKASEYPFLTQIARCTGWKRLRDDALD